MALRLYDDLRRAGVSPWLDRKKLLPGQNWQRVITQALQDSAYILTLLSSHSVTKRGYVQKELKAALDLVDEFPPSKIFIIPVRLDDCRPSDERLMELHWVDLFPAYEEGLSRILRVLLPEEQIEKMSSFLKKRQEFGEIYDLLSEKINHLRKALAIETDVVTKFKLEKQIEEAETERVAIEEQLEEVASQLLGHEYRVPKSTEEFVPEIKPYNLIAIREILQKELNLSELEELSWNIGLDISTMRTDYSDSFAIDIVKNAEQLGKISALIDAIDRIKPSKKFVEQIFASEISTPVRSFLSNVGFEIRTVSSSGDFIAEPLITPWSRRFSRGLYVILQLNEPLDQEKVHAIYQKAKEYTDHSFVVINRQPKLDGWMAIASMRLKDSHPFVLIPITDTVIHEGLASKSENRIFAGHIEKYVGRGYNPYDVRDPVFDVLSFFGREGIIDEISNEITLGKRVGLFGLHKIGKSSVLKTLPKKVEFPVAYVYLTENISIDNIYENILKAWEIDLRTKYPSFEWSKDDTKQDAKASFESAVKNLLFYLEETVPIQVPHLSIFLDEIETIIPYKEGDENTLNRYIRLMDSLRGLQQETEKLSLLVAGVHPTMARVNYFWGEQKNPMHQVVVEKFLPPLERDDCEVMVRSLGKQIGLDYDDETMEFILRKSGAHPYLARQLCSAAYQKHKEVGVMPFEVVREAAEEFVYNPSRNDYFNDNALWGELAKEHLWGQEVAHANHQLLLKLAACKEGLSKTELSQGIPRVVFEQSFAALKERSIISLITETDRYQITFELFQDWIRAHKLHERS